MNRVKDTITVGLLGLGTVGSGVVKIIEKHQQKLQHQIGCPVKVGKVLVRDLAKKRDVDFDEALLTDRVEDIIENDDIDVVIEVMGGVEQTRQWLLTALKNKKHIVTANKDLMAVYGPELLKVAADNGCDLYYEASVAGGIPIIRTLVDGLSSDRITKMMGIVNGTTNFILTKMTKESASYDVVLKEAQDLGYAEADPTSDVEGLDAARKMAILARLGFSMSIDLDDVDVCGISNVTLEDIQYSHKLGYTMKLIGMAEETNGKVAVSVQPTLLPHNHPLASVNDEYNAVYVYGKAVGETMFYGPGAGQLPTATSIVSDLVTVLKNMRLGVSGKGYVFEQFEKNLKSPEEIRSKYFLRLQVKDQSGVLAQITSVFAQYEASLEKILQLPCKDRGEGLAELIIVTHHTNKKDYDTIVKQLQKLDVVDTVVSSYRVEGEEK